jgi:hypothetical protein
MLGAYDKSRLHALLLGTGVSLSREVVREFPARVLQRPRVASLGKSTKRWEESSLLFELSRNHGLIIPQVYANMQRITAHVGVRRKIGCGGGLEYCSFRPAPMT